MYTYSKEDKEFIISIVYHGDEHFRTFDYRQYIDILIDNLREVLNQYKHAK